MKRAALILLVLTTVVKLQAQEEKPYTQPKLVVGVVVDQMRFDYLTRFWDRFGEGGFKRLVNEGFEAKKPSL